MHINVTLDEEDIGQALENYIQQNAPVPMEGNLEFEIVPAKGTAKAYAIATISSKPTAANTVNTVETPAPANKTEPLNPADTDVRANEVDNGYAAMDRPEILKLCAERGIAVRGEGASKDKRTTTLIKELEEWDAAPPEEEPIDGKDVAENTVTPSPPSDTTDNVFNAPVDTPTESLFDAMPEGAPTVTAPAGENVPSDVAGTEDAVMPVPETIGEQPADMQSLFGA